MKRTVAAVNLLICDCVGAGSAAGEHFRPERWSPPPCIGLDRKQKTT